MSAGAPAVEGFATRLAAVRARVAAACERAGRDPAAITIIGVSKTQPAVAVEAALRAGLRDFGENRVQEAVAKMAALGPLAAGDAAPVFHLIGHLQTNKVRDAVGSFAMIHSVDSERLLRALSAAAGRRLRVFIEVNVAGESTKEGVAPGELARLLGCARSLPMIGVEGLMTVAPLAGDPETVRPVFRALRRLAAEHGLTSLSMGMSGDFEVAIEEGATHVRIGRALFGERLN